MGQSSLSGYVNEFFLKKNFMNFKLQSHAVILLLQTRLRFQASLLVGLFVSRIVTTGLISMKFGGRIGNGTRGKPLNFGAYPVILISVDNLALAEIFPLLLSLSP